MRPKNRLTRILLILLLVFLFAGYFAFSTFLFSPTEARFGADLSTLVPKGVDFFFSKAELAADVDPFPRLSEWDRIAGTAAWNAFERHDLKELDAEYGLTSKYEELAALPAQIRGFDPLRIFGGRKVALAGYFRGADLGQADWAAYGRVGWRGKLAASLLRYPGLLGLQQQGLKVDVADDHLALSGDRLPRTLYLARIRDVVIVGTSLEQVRSALDLNVRKGEKSFGQSATYFDTIEKAPRNAEHDEIEFSVDNNSLMGNLQLSGKLPDTEADDFLPALLGRLFQVGLVNSLSGVVGFHSGVQIDLRGELSSELMSAAQKRLYGRSGREREWLIGEAARIVRADSSLFVYLECSFADLARQIFESFEPALQVNLEDTLRGTGEYNDWAAFSADMDSLFKGRIALIVRPNDYPTDPEKDPPNDGRPMPAWAVVLWHEGDAQATEKISKLHDLIVRNQGLLGLQGKEPGQKGVYTNRVEGFDIWEFWNKLIEGTGHLATAEMNELYIVSNSFRMLGDMLKVYVAGDADHPRLADRPEFRPLMQSSLAKANLLLWANPRSLGKIRREFAERRAVDEVLGDFNWAGERERLERDVLRTSFPGRLRNQLGPAEQSDLDAKVDAQIDQVERNLREQHVPARKQTLQREILYSELATAVLIQLSLDTRNLNLSVRALVPLEDPEPGPSAN
jgi:hypothetical protein